jgi:PAS domain S-box-containing protein
MSKQPFIEGPVADAWGRWVSAHAPILDPATDETIAIVGLDIDASRWEKNLLLYKVVGVSIPLFMAIVVIVFSTALFKVNIINIRLNHEITDRKRAEDELHKRETTLQAVFDTAPVGICIMKNRVYQRVNRAWCVRFGYQEETLIGRTTEFLYESHEEYERIKKELYEDIFTKGIGSARTRLKRSDGEFRDVDLTAKPLNPEILYAGTVVVVHDITELKRAEKERTLNIQRMDVLLQLNQMTEATLQEITDFALEEAVRLTQSEIGYLAFLNGDESVLTMHSWSKSAMAECSIADKPIIYPVKATGLWGEAVRQRQPVITNDYTTSSPLKKGYPEGHVTVRRHMNIPVFVGPRIVLVAGVGNKAEEYNQDDVQQLTLLMEGMWRLIERNRSGEEKLRLEEQLQRAEKMEALGTLAGGVAHDLNNVLGSVIGFAELLLMEIDVSNPFRPKLEKIMIGGQKAAAIVEDLLALARRGVPSRSVLNLNKIIVSNLNSSEFENLSSFHPGVRIRTALDPDLLNTIGSAVHLGKTLFNLVSNAAEAMPAGGILTVKTANQYLDKPIKGYDEIREGDYVVLSVSDTGDGILAADLKRIFEPFYTKKVMGRSGTGLGLAVVWGTVKDHRGYINVQSKEGQGSTFILYLPVTREELPEKAVAIAISEYMGKGESLLVVDDVKDQRELATTMLRKLNYHVESVSSGEEALDYIKAQPVDLMVLDMIMDPGMDGLNTYRSVLEIRPKQKAIIVSGFSESERVVAAQALGAGAYVRKPYIMEKLGPAVKKELERSE